jgi:hypothetical protein
MPRKKSRLLVDPRLVILAVGAAVGGPCSAVFKQIDTPERCVWVAIGVLAWWYLFRCVKEMWARRTVESEDTDAPAPHRARGGSGTGADSRRRTRRPGG